MLKFFVGLIAILIFASTAYGQARTEANLQRFAQKGACVPEEAEKTHITVALYTLNPDRSTKDKDVIVFVVTSKTTGDQFYAEQNLNYKSQKGFDRVVYYTKAKDAKEWVLIGEVLPSMTKEQQKPIIQKAHQAFLELFPVPERTGGFKEIWREAGCTTHGPTPFGL